MFSAQHIMPSLSAVAAGVIISPGYPQTVTWTCRDKRSGYDVTKGVHLHLTDPLRCYLVEVSFVTNREYYRLIKPYYQRCISYVSLAVIHP